MRTNEVKKGTIVRRADGVLLEVMDNKKGSARKVKLHDDPHHSPGADAAWRWVQALVGGVWVDIELTAQQVKGREYVLQTMGG